MWDWQGMNALKSVEIQYYELMPYYIYFFVCQILFLFVRLHDGPQPIVACRLSQRVRCHQEAGARAELR